MGQPNSRPFEIIGAPFKVYRAPVGTAFPAVDEDPAVDWVLIGTSGDLNYSDDGVQIQHSQEFNYARALGDSGSRKAFRTTEDLEISLTLWDCSIEQYRVALNNNSITTVAASSGVPGSKKVGLSRGLGIDTMALLVRGPSPYDDDMTMQFEVPVCIQSGSPQIQFRRDQPAGLALAWRALVDQDASSADERFGRLIAQTADAT